jgi:hypothetical protein
MDGDPFDQFSQRRRGFGAILWRFEGAPARL